MALKVVKSAGHYTETAVDEIKLLKCVRRLPYRLPAPSELPGAWQCGCRPTGAPGVGWNSQKGSLQLALPKWEALEEPVREGPADSLPPNSPQEWERRLPRLAAVGDGQAGDIRGPLAFAPGPRQ